MDLINVRILRELRENGRIPNTQLADRVGLSPPACLRRVQDLERAGAITGYHAAIDQTVLGRDFIVYAAVSLSDHSRGSLEHFANTIRDLSEVAECHKVTGAFEFLLRIEVEDAKSYDAFHTNVLSGIPNVISINTHVVINSVVGQGTGSASIKLPA